MDQIFHDNSLSPILLIEEVEQIVIRAAEVGGILQVSPHAKRLRSSLAGSGFSEKRIANELIRAAARAGIPIEISG